MTRNQSLFFSLSTISKTNIEGRKTLGTGGGGRVDLIRHNRDPSRLFALKTIPLIEGGFYGRVKAEIDLHKSMDHPSIIKVHGSEFKEKEVFLFLEYASAGDLFHALHFPRRLPKPLTFALKMKIFVQSVLGVEYMHSKGILHRDLKLENILLNEDLDAKLCDFGWAVELNHPKRRRSMCGTIEYMAPEVFDQSPHTTKVDIWALGTNKHFSS